MKNYIFKLKIKLFSQCYAWISVKEKNCIWKGFHINIIYKVLLLKWNRYYRGILYNRFFNSSHLVVHIKNITEWKIYLWGYIWSVIIFYCTFELKKKYEKKKELIVFFVVVYLPSKKIKSMIKKRRTQN